MVVLFTEGLYDDYNQEYLVNNYYVKRLIGLPNEIVRITKNEQILIKQKGSKKFVNITDIKDQFKTLTNGKANSYKPVRQYFVPVNKESGYKTSRQKDYDEYQLADDQYFVLGDNSDNSLDSRYWGTINRKHIVGKTFFIFFPFFSRNAGFTD